MAAPSSSFTIKDYVSISISLIALSLSLIGFYFANYRKVDHLEARIIDVDLIEGKEKIKSDTLKIDIAYINKGNRQAILMLPWFHHASVPDDSLGAEGFETDNRQDFPQVLEPSKVKLSSLKVPVTSISLNFPDSVLHEKCRSDYDEYAKLQFYALDSKAIVHDEFSSYLIKLTFRKGKFILATCINIDDKKEFRDFSSTTIFDSGKKGSRQKTKEVAFFKN